MEIRELTTDFKLSITISNQQSKKTLQSNIVYVSGNSVYVEPFTYNGTVLNFDSQQIAISMIAYQDEKAPICWKVVTVRKEVEEGVTYHVIESGVNGVKINRRENFRVFLGINGKAYVLGQNEKMDVIVKDISETGFAVLIPVATEIKFKRNDVLVIEFYDRGQEESFTLSGRIVRGESLEKYNLFGCRLIKDSHLVRRYIANKQLEKRVNSARKGQ